MAQTFKVGDQVQLKSGGPIMTVTAVFVGSGNRDVVRCDWFAGKKVEQGDFPPDALVPAPQEEKPKK